MFLEAKITIDPAQITQINKIKPTKAFKKFLYHLTLGNVSDKEERETFTAVAILQQLNAAYRNMGIDNMIKLSHDAIDFYHDKEGKANDLKLAMDMYEIKVDTSMSTHFKQLHLVLEHEDKNFKYLIETVINRDHEVGVYPIEITIAALFKEFNTEDPRNKISETVKSQTVFDHVREDKIQLFEYFLNQLKLALKKQIKIEDILSEIKTKHIVPKKKVTSKSTIAHYPSRGGIYGGYYGFDDYIFYSLIWSDVMHNHGTLIKDSHFEDDTGKALGYAEEISSSEVIFDSDTETTAICDQYFDPDPSEVTDSSESGSWFDFDSWGSDSDISFDSDCSSCSSCGSCGGD